MVNLPNEIIHAIIAKYQAGPSPWHLAPLATINRSWQVVVESYIWRIFGFGPAGSSAELERFRSAFRAESGRRKVIDHLEITFDGYFAFPFAINHRTKRGRSDEDVKEEQEHEQEQDTIAEISTGASENDLNSTNQNETVDTCRIKTVTVPISAIPPPAFADQNQEQHMRFVAFQKEHARFFREVKAIWDQLNEWGDDLSITTISFHVKGTSLYKFLGPEFCERGADYFKDRSTLWLANLPDLPSLPCVRHLRVWETVNEEMDLWPAVVTSKIAATLPMLETLDLSGFDWEQRWPQLRNHLRQVQALAVQLSALNAPLKTMHICLEYNVIANHEIRPQNFLIRGTDTFSRSIHHLSTSLTILALRVNYITASLFWDPNNSSENTYRPTWPNLRVLDVTTGFERPTGNYWFRSDENYPDHDRYDFSRYEIPDPEELTPEDRLYRLAGLLPRRHFLIRPEPELFDQLALGIARATARMPKLEYLDLDFHAWHQRKHCRGTFDDKFEEYEGWGFYFRASNEARCASTHAKPYWFEHKCGIDLTGIDSMRTEWVFQCPYEQLQWKEPEEARLLWQDRSAHIDFDVVTFDQDKVLWERRRNGELILSSQKDE